MKRASAGFVLHYDFDEMLGGRSAGARTRQRWLKEGLLGEPSWLSVGRARIGVIPEFSLARAVVGPSVPAAERRNLMYVVEAHRRVMGPQSPFHELGHLAADRLRVLYPAGQAWTLEMVVMAMVVEAPDQFAVWLRGLRAAELDLANFGVHLASEPGYVLDAREQVVDVRSSGEQVWRIPERLVRTHVELGRPVALNRIELLGRSQAFVVPIVTGLLEPAPAEREDERELEASSPTPLERTMLALQSGVLTRKLPPRFAGDPDAVLAMRAADAAVATEPLDRFEEGTYEPEVRRGSFRPGKQ
jgi:hypothetical protein